MKPSATSLSNRRNDSTTMKANPTTTKDNRKKPPSVTANAAAVLSLLSTNTSPLSSQQNQRVNWCVADVALSTTCTFPETTRDDHSTTTQKECTSTTGAFDKMKKLTITWTDEDSQGMKVWNEPNPSVGDANNNFRWCGIITNVCHAWNCPFNDIDGGVLAKRRCTILSGCRASKDLYQHIQPNTCNGIDCKYGNAAIQHFKRCKLDSCPICGPVCRHVPMLLQEIQTATAKSHGEIAMVKNAQGIIMKEIVNIYNANTNTSTDTKTKSAPPPSLSSPSIPRVIGVAKRSDVSVDVMECGPTKKHCRDTSRPCSN